ncbi:hypothetical protein BC835DRAFT_1306390 [Cytidiella melzeri]|nr:hypothetical protein BC835DRAFT_1306390 [Cytidiella melzeri]
MQSSLASTLSGSFLISASRISSDHEIAPPVIERLPPLTDHNWRSIYPAKPLHQQSQTELISHARELTVVASRAKQHTQGQDTVIEAAQAQLVIQELYAKKVHEALFTQDNKKPRDHTKIVFKDGKGRHLTHEKIVETLEGMEHEKAKREVAKKQKSLTRTAQQTARRPKWASVTLGRGTVFVTRPGHTINPLYTSLIFTWLFLKNSNVWERDYQSSLLNDDARQAGAKPGRSLNCGLITITTPLKYATQLSLTYTLSLLMVGYLAFPPNAPTNPLSRAILGNPHEPPPSPSNSSHSYASKQSPDASDASKRAAKANLDRERFDEMRRTRLEREREQIYHSELDWVRSGGILRDANGRRDKLRTEQFRKEIRLQAEERAIMERWDVYESRVRALQGTQHALAIGWDTIPWPMNPPPSSPADIHTAAIANFIFATFKVRGAKVARKERLRTSILRWHPDKFTALVARIPEPDQSMILDGVNAVFRALRQLQSEDRQSFIV